MKVEEMINSLPFKLFRTYEYKCDCGHTYTKKHTYELEIKLIEHYRLNDEPEPRYLVFYICRDFGVGSSKRYIGCAAGMGERTLEEAIQGLKRYIND